MLNCLETQKSTTTTHTSTISLTFFKPRQVLLNSKQTTTNMTPKNPISTTPENTVLFHQSIFQVLHKNGFSKSAKYFQKEANLEKDSLKSCSVDLEEVFYEYLQTRNCNKAVDKAIKEKSTHQKDCGASNGEFMEAVEVVKENGQCDGKKSEMIIENESVDGTIVKSKKKKKNKSAKDSSEQDNEDIEKKKKNEDGSEFLNKELQEQSEVATKASEKADLVEKKDKKDKSKDKKKKHKDNSEHLNENVQEKKSEVVAVASENADNVVEGKKEKKRKFKTKKMDDDTSVPNDSSMGLTDGDEEKKVSKKRKKTSSEENGSTVDEAIDVPKRRKTNISDESNGLIQPPETANGYVNGVLDVDGGNKSQDKAKLRYDSSEPRSANAFRRVKEEEVKFVDDRLKDNSYWAKGGADIGYGAKAQEVLGQVRGRDFRHEKTKKKRGSYRGGQIDLQSHSVKFQYDDEEE